MTPEPHSRYEELVAGYALSALEPEDEQHLVRHLRSCAACERDLAVHRETLAHLAYAGDTAVPPASLWEGIRSEVLSSGAPVSFPSPEASAAPAEVVPLSHARARRRPGTGRAAGLVAAAAAFALVAGLAAWNVALQRERGQLQQQLAATRTVEPPAPRTAALTAGNGEVAAVAVVRAGRVSLVVDDLPPNDPAASTYVLWGRAGDGPVRALAAFDVREQPQVTELEVPRSPDAPWDLLMVTREPGRTAPAATTQPLLASGRVT